MKKFISILLVLCILASMQLAFAGGYVLTKVLFADNEYYFLIKDCAKENHQGETPPITLSLLDFGSHPNGQNLETLLFPAKTTGVYDDGREVIVCGANLSFLSNAKTKTVILANGIKHMSLDLDHCSNLKSIVIPESISELLLSHYHHNQARFMTAKEAQYCNLVHGQTDGEDTVFIFEQIEKDLGLTNGSIYEKIKHEAFGETVYVNILKPEYETTVHNYVEKYFLSAHAKSFQTLSFYVKEGSYAESYLRSLGFNVKQYVSVSYNGSEIYSDQPAVIDNGRTLVPLRAAFESMDATVNWNGSTQTVTAKRGGTAISLAIGSNQLYVNGTAKTIDVPAQIMNGRTMVPIRAVAEAFGCDVSWDSSTKTAIIQE